MATACAAFAGDLWDLLETLGLVPPCPPETISFSAVSASAPWLWNVSFQETKAGNYYMDIFFQEEGECDRLPPCLT